MLKTSRFGRGSRLSGRSGQILAPGACTSLVQCTKQIRLQPLLTTQTLAFLRGTVPSCLPFCSSDGGPQASSASWAHRWPVALNMGFRLAGCVAPMAAAREKTLGQGYMGETGWLLGRDGQQLRESLNAPLWFGHRTGTMWLCQS